MLVNQFLFLGAILFCIGVYGVLARRNAVLILMSIELILNAVNINLIAFSTFWGLGGQVFALFVIAVAAAEVQSQFQRVMRERIALNPTQAHAIARSRTEEPLVLQKPTTPAVLNNAIAVQLGLANLHPQEAGRP